VTSLGFDIISSTSTGEALRLTYSSPTTSLRCAISPMRWMMYSTILFSLSEEWMVLNSLSQKDLF
jgi:hypothetical protein